MPANPDSYMHKAENFDYKYYLPPLTELTLVNWSVWHITRHITSYNSVALRGNREMVGLQFIVRINNLPTSLYTNQYIYLN